MSNNNTFPCPHCKTPIPDGAFVCTGCNGDVVYGVADFELIEAGNSGTGIGATLGIILVGLFPALTSNTLGWNIPLGLGLGLWSLGLVAVMALFGGWYARAQAAKTRTGQVRVFRRR